MSYTTQCCNRYKVLTHFLRTFPPGHRLSILMQSARASLSMQEALAYHMLCAVTVH